MRGLSPARVVVRRVAAADIRELIELARVSRGFHRPWIYLTDTRAVWRRHLDRMRDGRFISYVVRRRDTRELVGVFNLSEIVRGTFQSAYLGFYAHARHAGRGFMAEGLRVLLARAFGAHRLHRVEANIQPGNDPSRRLVKRAGFRREGFSPKYLKVGGRWRDHERWAITREMWR